MGTMHHLAVGCGDTTVIVMPQGTLLVDCWNIKQHRSLLPANKQLKAVFITHQHWDHFGGLAYLRSEGYSIEYLIHSPYERRYADSSVTTEEWTAFNSDKDHFRKNGTKVYTPYRQDSFDKPWWNVCGIQVWMLGPYASVAKSDTRELHDACLVMKAHFSQRKCLFTGDASDTSLEKIASSTTHMCDDILHASHHGSLEGAQLDFVKKCNASYTVVSTESGVHQNVPHPTAMQRYRDHTANEVYRTDEDGSLKWTV